MDILEFANQHHLKWFPLNLDKKRPLYQKEYSSTPTTNDFEKLDEMELLERQELVDQTNAIALDTKDIFHIDVDFKDDIDYEKDYPEAFNFVKKLIDDKVPYYKSLTKKNGKHFFFKTNDELTSKRPQLKYKDIEILAGQWSFSTKTRKVYGDNNIPDLSIKEHLPQDKPKTVKKFKIKRNQIKNNKMEAPAGNSEIQKYADLIDIQYLDEYDSWTKIIWSLANDDNNNNYEIAKNISAKSEKYNEEEFNRLWNKSREGSTMGTFYYYCKISNKQKFFEFRSEEITDTFFTEDNLAKIYLDSNQDDIIYKDDLVYIFHNRLWYEDRKLNKLKFYVCKYLTEYLGEIGIQLYKKVIECEQDEKLKGLAPNYRKQLDEVNKCLASVQTATKKTKISECIIHNLSIIDFTDIEFDMNGYLLPFKNNVYDLRTHKFRKAEKYDYIINNIPYNLEDRDSEKILLLENLFNKIFPDEEIKENYFAYLVTCLYGVHVEKFVIANGGGGNGKGLINELMEEMLTSSFCYKCSNAVLLQPLKEGINTQVANMDKKRMIIYSEPDSTVKKINGSTMKELTGGKGISAERKYSMNNKVVLKSTHILETNNRPKIDGRIDDSYIRRLVDIPFKSTFTADKQILKETDRQNTFEADTTYKTDEWKDTFKHQLFHYLISFSKSYKQKYGYECIEKIESCKEVKQRTKEYLENSDEKFEWFKNTYQKKEGHVEPIKDIFNYFKQSEYYINLPKKDKRSENYSNFTKYIQENVNFRSYYREQIDKVVNGKRFYKRNVMVGWAYEPKEEENDTDDEGL
jgi:phage/plasmid-associated DNA primase